MKQPSTPQAKAPQRRKRRIHPLALVFVLLLLLMQFLRSKESQETQGEVQGSIQMPLGSSPPSQAKNPG